MNRPNMMLCLWLPAMLTLAACETTRTDSSATTPSATTRPAGAIGSLQTNANPPTSPALDKPLAYLEGQPIGTSGLLTPLLEASGGQVLSEIVLGHQLSKRLAAAGLKLTPEMLEAERDILLKSLDPEPNQAMRLMRELRQRRGLGEARWDQYLARQAALRLLVKDQAEVTDAAVRQEYELQYGPRLQARLITVESLRKASDMARRARAGESFMDLAIAHSTDESAAQGGLLPTISPLDPEYPTAIRSAMSKLEVGQVSDPVALDVGFAVLRLERKIAARPVQFDDVKTVLTEQVRLNAQRLLMLRLARTLISESELVIMDPTLRRSWEQHRREMLPSPGR